MGIENKLLCFEYGFVSIHPIVQVNINFKGIIGVLNSGKVTKIGIGIGVGVEIGVLEQGVSVEDGKVLLI